MLNKIFVVKNMWQFTNVPAVQTSLVMSELSFIALITEVRVITVRLNEQQ